MLPGHHGTFGLRISRALVRMSKKRGEHRQQQDQAGANPVGREEGLTGLEFEGDLREHVHAPNPMPGAA